MFIVSLMRAFETTKAGFRYICFLFALSFIQGSRNGADRF